MNELRLRRAFMFTACLVLVRLDTGSAAKCGGTFLQCAYFVNEHMKDYILNL